MKNLRETISSLVRRPGAEDHLLITLLAFALSVTFTRFFLGLTGYPQLGGGTLHIAHVLWGGLILFVAALLPLIFANHRIHKLTAVLAGLGVGLFIDEVGKFITQANDYFYQPAAPIIYAFFLVCVLAYLQVSRPRTRQPRQHLFAALEYLEEVLERDLDEHEHQRLITHLEASADQDEEPELARLARVLLDFTRSDKISLVPPNHNLLDDFRERFLDWQSRTFGRPGVLLGVFAGLGLFGLAHAGSAAWLVVAGLQPGNNRIGSLFGSIAGTALWYWYFSIALFLALTGVGLILGARWLWKIRAQKVLIAAPAAPQERRFGRGLRWSYASLVLQLTVLDLLLFYYLQFGTIALVAVQFTLLLAVRYYQRTA